MDAAPSVAVPAARARAFTAAPDSFLAAVLALLALAGVLGAPLLLVDDGWYTLAAGRLVAHHGIPHADTLTAIAHGRPWTDEQWLAQLLAYGLWAVAGLRGVLVGVALAVEAALGIAIVAARRGGATPAAAAASALLALVAAPWLLLFRAQTFALPLFVVLLVLLVADSRAPSRRVLWTLPLLALWANLHGSVLLAAGLVLLRALGRATAARRLSRPENLATAALLAGAPAAVLCTPYGLAVVGYYRTVMVGNEFARYLTEWQPTRLGPWSAAFFALAVVVAFRAGRRPGRLTRFEHLTLALLGVLALHAIRNVPWFALAAAVSLPRLLAEGESREPPAPVRRLQLGVAAVAVAAAALVAVAGPVPAGPAKVGDAVAALAARDPSLRIFPEDQHADWLVWTHPELAGRVAYDVRYELLTVDEIRALVRQRRGVPVPLARGYRLFLLDRHGQPALRARLLHVEHGRVVARDASLEAILLPRA